MYSRPAAVFQIGDDEEEEEKQVEFDREEVLPSNCIELNQQAEQQFQGYKVPRRQKAVECYHRLPQVGKKVVMD